MAGAGGRRHRLGRARQVGAAVVAAALMVVAAVAVPAPPVAADSATPWSVSATPTANLTDGEAVSITVRTDDTFPLYEAEARICRAGVTYQPGDGSRPNDDFAANGPNCPLTKISSSADNLAVDDNLAPDDTTPDGETFTFHAGIGVVDWTAAGTATSLTCDPDHPCDLVVELLGGPAGGPAIWFPWTVQLAFENSDPVAGCGGPSTGVLSAGGSDSLTDAWVAWTLAQCHQPGQTGAATRMTFNGEGTAVADFASGNLDLAYSAVGYDADAGYVAPGSIPGGPRATVAVPIALGATVLALGNGHFSGVNNRKVPYGPTDLTLDETAALLSGGPSGDIGRLIPAIDARNPDLLQSGFFDTSSSLLVGAPSDAESSSFLMTRELAADAPGEWKVPNLPLFGDDAGRARGVDSSLAVASPSYSQALGLFTGRPSLQRSLESIGPDQGGVWVLTDLTTARSLGMTAVSLGTGSGPFVAPTPATMAAAVPTMTTTADGLAIPDTAAVSTGAYPLTYVEYALVPAQALVDPTTCQPRTAAQAQLTSWLQFLVGPGQSDLPDGLAPLPPSLAATASHAITLVGATPGSSCSSGVGAPDAPASAAGGGVANASAVPPADLTSGSSDADLSSTGSSATVSASSSTQNLHALAVASSTPIPGYGGGRTASGLFTALAVLAILVLTSGAALVSSGRRRRPPAGGP